MPASGIGSSANIVTGSARVTDGDTIVIGAVKIRLFGIDAPEQDQTCTRANGAVWACGAWATAQLEDRLQGQNLHCEGVEQDRYGRLVARCFLGITDIAVALVQRGVVFAYAKYAQDYLGDEDQARRAGLGLWQGMAQRPEVFRATLRAADNAARAVPDHIPATCAIKGNISAAGKIFHRPGDLDYARTRISNAKGERWFCSAAEAKAAGWRASRR